MTHADVPDSNSGLWYFAYGSNLHRGTFIERRKMSPLATRWGWLADYRLCFNIPVGPGERGVANIKAEVGARTCGALYLLSITDFDRLDHTEGVQFNLYRRVSVAVTTAGGERIGAFAYQSALTTLGRKPSPRYMRLLLDGARELQLPPEYVDFLHTFELAIDERKDENSSTPI